MGAEARCPSCGGLVALGAEWCGQCYAPLRPAEAPPSPTSGGPAGSRGREADRAPEDVPPPPEGAERSASVATPGGGNLEIAGGTASWDCPVCGERNPIRANACGVCGTPFARLFERPEERPQIEPASAARWSLVFAGLGHWKAGHHADGVARAVLFAWTIGTVIVILLSRPDQGGFGRVFPFFALYLSSAVAVYVLSVVDAYRVSGGQPPVVASRTLLWCAAALVLVSILLATFIALPAAHG